MVLPIGVVEAAGSSPVTQTKKSRKHWVFGTFLYLPEALKSGLTTYLTRNRIISVFGAAGGRSEDGLFRSLLWRFSLSLQRSFLVARRSFTLKKSLCYFRPSAILCLNERSEKWLVRAARRFVLRRDGVSARCRKQSPRMRAERMRIYIVYY